MPTLPCEDGAGALNNPDNDTNTGLTPYVVTSTCVGGWEISNQTDICAQNETKLQEGYAAENININGAPLNVFKLLGVHEQGEGSILSRGTIVATAPAPGYPLSNLNSGSAPWHSLQSGNGVAGVAYVGVDFGSLELTNGKSEYAPSKPNWQSVGAVTIKQGNTAFNFARQVRVDIADGVTESGSISFTGTGNGTLTISELGPESVPSTIRAVATSATEFTITMTPVVGTLITLGTATVGTTFKSTHGSVLITAGSTPFISGDVFSFPVSYVWKRAGVFNLVQSASAITMNLQTVLLVKAVRVVPTLFTGNTNWEVLEFDVLDSPPTDINNVQDLFFQENRDRDYSKTPIMIKAQYSINDSITDLSRFGLNILDQYSFVVSFPVMVSKLGRPLVTGDIIEVTPELQYDHNLNPIRKFLEVSDTGWASQGFSSGWRPTLYRFAAQEVIPSQETRDLFGTIDTQKYLTADSILVDGVGEQIDVSPLTSMEELAKEAVKKVPERGSDDGVSVDAVHSRVPAPPVNAKGQPVAAAPTINTNANLYIEDGLPKNGESYNEGYALPEESSSTDGQFFRLYYPESTKIPPRLYRFSAVKNKWIFLETDRRIEYSSAKPSLHKMLNSPTKQNLKAKQV